MPGLTFGLEPGGNVYAVTVKIRAVCDHVTDVHANAEANVSFWRLFSVIGRHLPLHFNREAHRAIAVKGDQEGVATSLNQRATMLIDCRFD